MIGAYRSRRGPIRECHDGPAAPWRERAYTPAQQAALQAESHHVTPGSLDPAPIAYCPLHSEES